MRFIDSLKPRLANIILAIFLDSIVIWLLDKWSVIDFITFYPLKLVYTLWFIEMFLIIFIGTYLLASAVIWALIRIDPYFVWKTFFMPTKAKVFITLVFCVILFLIPIKISPICKAFRTGPCPTPFTTTKGILFFSSMLHTGGSWYYNLRIPHIETIVVIIAATYIAACVLVFGYNKIWRKEPLHEKKH